LPWHDGEWTILKNKYNSFPSGHTAGAFGFFGVLVFARLSYAALAVIPAVAIGWSRFYLGALHLSDVWIDPMFGLECSPD
jgi:membrane-associated phospholipid phosphatase